VTAASDADMTVTASCQITITAQGVESITLTPDRLTLKPGETAAITAETAPEGALDSQVVWSSDHPEIANVDDKGVVTALSGGTATITAKAGTATAVATVVVKGGPAVNPGVKNPGTGLLQDSVLSAVVCAGILALAILGGLYYKRKAMR
ncbi:MAG: Ig-like domain-containing protein, partial [Eubacterium sp.]|nr:Ig-like domain-containing protein [Eubacterium sp.]